MEAQKGGLPQKNETISLLVYLLVSYIISGILLMLLAFFVYRFQLNESVVNIMILIIYALSAFTAGFCSGKKMKRAKYLWGFAMGAAYFTILILVSLIVNHTLKDFSGNFFTIMAICVGSGMLGGMLG